MTAKELVYLVDGVVISNISQEHRNLSPCQFFTCWAPEHLRDSHAIFITPDTPALALQIAVLAYGHSLVSLNRSPLDIELSGVLNAQVYVLREVALALADCNNYPAPGSPELLGVGVNMAEEGPGSLHEDGQQIACHVFAGRVRYTVTQLDKPIQHFAGGKHAQVTEPGDCLSRANSPRSFWADTLHPGQVVKHLCAAPAATQIQEQSRITACQGCLGEMFNGNSGMEGKQLMIRARAGIHSESSKLLCSCQETIESYRAAHVHIVAKQTRQEGAITPRGLNSMIQITTNGESVCRDRLSSHSYQFQPGWRACMHGLRGGKLLQLLKLGAGMLQGFYLIFDLGGERLVFRTLGSHYIRYHVRVTEEAKLRTQSTDRQQVPVDRGGQVGSDILGSESLF